MTGKDNRDDMKIDELLSDHVSHLEIEMPDNLDDYVDGLLDGLPSPKKKWPKRMMTGAASFVGLLFLISVMIVSNDSFAQIAKEVPVLNYLVDLLTTDLGSENALINGYPVKDPIIIHDGDYTLTIDHMMIDEERITFSALLVGPHFESPEEALKDDQDTIAEAINDAALGNDHFNETTDYAYFVRLLDGGASTTTLSGSTSGEVDVTIEFPNDSTYIRDIIDAGEDLDFACSIYKQKYNDSSEIYTFQTFDVPLSEEEVLLTQSLALDETIELDQGTIHFDSLRISPTKMQLIGKENPSEGYKAIGLDGDINLSPSNGQIYQSPSVSRSELGDVTYSIIPSIYFDDVNEMSLTFDHYYYEMPEISYDLSLDGIYPKTYDYYGYHFVVDEVKKSGDQLKVVSHIEDDGFDYQDFKFMDFEQHYAELSTRYDEEKEIESKTYYSYVQGIGDTQTFEFKLSYPKIMVEQVVHVTLDVSQIKNH